MSASTAPMDLMTGWRYPRTQPSVPESPATVRVLAPARSNTMTDIRSKRRKQHL